MTKRSQQHLHLVSDPDDAKPPYDPGAEQAVISAGLLDASALKRCRDILEPKHFYAEAHRLIWEAMLAIADRGVAVDVVTVCKELRPKRIKLAGGAAYLGQIVDSGSPTTNDFSGAFLRYDQELPLLYAVSAHYDQESGSHTRPSTGETVSWVGTIWLDTPTGSLK